MNIVDKRMKDYKDIREWKVVKLISQRQTVNKTSKNKIRQTDKQQITEQHRNLNKSATRTPLTRCSG